MKNIFYTTNKNLNNNNNTLNNEDIKIFIESTTASNSLDISEKAVIVFMGNSGVGKSSIIRKIFMQRRNNTPLPTKIETGFNINDNQEGTTDFIGIEDNNTVWLDCRGKRQSETIDEYLQKMVV